MAKKWILSNANLPDMKHGFTLFTGMKASLKDAGISSLLLAFVFIGFSSFSKERHLHPFELVSFHAKMKGNEKVMLNWVTVTEINTSHFVIQRSTDGIEFYDAALLFTGEGNRNTKVEYNYADNINTIKSDSLSYRLKMVDLNGAYTFSDPIKVHIEKVKDLIAFQ